jgi:hypothetical protein
MRTSENSVNAKFAGVACIGLDFVPRGTKRAVGKDLLVGGRDRWTG